LTKSGTTFGGSEIDRFGAAAGRKDTDKTKVALKTAE